MLWVFIKIQEKNCCEEQIDRLINKNHYCTIFNSHESKNKNKINTHRCKKCLNKYGNQPQLENRLIRCNKQENCNLSFMSPDTEMKFTGWWMKIDPPMWIDADFECSNVPVDDPPQRSCL